MLDILALLAQEILIQSFLGLGGRYELKPFFLRVLTVGGQYLDLVAALQLIGQRHERVVDLGADTMLADLGVE